LPFTFVVAANEAPASVASARVFATFLRGRDGGREIGFTAGASGQSSAE
jgi:hypothetical protein